MSKILENLEPKNVMHFFERISEIPRGSKNEKQISDYLVDFAKERGLEYIQDNSLNVIIKKSASKGYEHVPSMIIQGHMDMVCEKNQDTIHDFEKDGIKLQVENGWIKATGTTLGADNGIAVAFALALLDSKTLEHPELEVLITSDEEMGMTGALALDPSLLKSNILINIDTEEENELYVSCSGGARGVYTVPVNFKTVESFEAWHLKVRGLQGGHSGCDAHEQRANSNKILGRTLLELDKNLDIQISEVYGGAKENAIPREADAIIKIDNIEKAKEIINICNETFRNEYIVSDKDIRLELVKVEANKILSKEDTKKVINTYVLHPNGVKGMSMDIEGLVETSLNLGVVRSEDDKVTFKSALRSSVLSKKIEMINELKAMAELCNCTFEDLANYPAWSYRQESKIRDIFADVYKNLHNKEIGIKAIHAGLECGLFDEKFDNIDMISFGPNIKGAHTPEERVEIKSIQNVWNYFVAVMKESKNYF